MYVCMHMNTNIQSKNFSRVLFAQYLLLDEHAIFDLPQWDRQVLGLPLLLFRKVGRSRYLLDNFSNVVTIDSFGKAWFDK